jgi:hypothetical protein
MMQTKRGEMRARVFISCGQSKGTDEEGTAKEVADELSRLGYEPYIGVQEQTLSGLKENIFRQLGKSDYFIFIDFKREQLANKEPLVYRGSLFSHQELALASYLEIDVMAFQESGVKTDDGILQFLQTNATQFTDRTSLPNLIAEEVGKRDWNPRWRNELVLELKTKHYDVPRIDSTGREFQARFFHINVYNRHRSKVATNCYVYLLKATNLDSSAKIRVQPIALKWAAYTLPNAQILPREGREFSAFWIAHDSTTTLNFSDFSDAEWFSPPIEHEGRYKFTYQVMGDNFPPASWSFTLSLDRSLDLTTLKSSGPPKEIARRRSAHLHLPSQMQSR